MNNPLPNRTAPGTPRRIVLTGFMGCGKTTVGRLLAERLGWRFADLDDLVAERHGASVPQIFASHGEAFFRTLEAEALGGALGQSELVLALGGGAVETKTVRDCIASDPYACVAFLDAPFDILMARCAEQARDPEAVARPLLASREAARARYERRGALYASAATLRVSAIPPDPRVVTEAVIAALGLQVPRE